MALWWTPIISASTRMLSLSLGCFEYARRQCYLVVSAVPSFLPQRTTLVAREHRTPPPPLPEPKYLDLKNGITLEYIDIQSTENPPTKQATIVLIHGAPGSYRDFRYLIPLLAQQPGVRIIGLNLPGYGGSVIEKAHYLEAVGALRAAEMALGGIRRLCGVTQQREDVFLVGHSFGAHTVMNMAALNAAETQSALGKVAIRGMALLAPAGCTPHKSLNLRAIAVMVKMLKSESAWIVSTATQLTKFVYTKLLRFPRDSPVGPYVSALIRADTTDFDLVRRHANLLGNLQTPTLLAWAQNDEHIQPDIPEELATLWPDGPHLEFTGGGHNIQKTRAEQISSAVNKWIEDVQRQS